MTTLGFYKRNSYLLKTVEQLTNGLRVVYGHRKIPNLEHPTKIDHNIIILIVKQEPLDDVIAEFSIDATGSPSQFASGNTNYMGINVDEEYLGTGLAKTMIAHMVLFIEREIDTSIQRDQLLFIDADASGGFWEYIGMKEHRYGTFSKIRNPRRVGLGYEKVISFSDLAKFGLERTAGQGGVYKKKKQTKKSKTKTKTKSKKSKSKSKSKTKSKSKIKSKSKSKSKKNRV